MDASEAITQGYGATTYCQRGHACIEGNPRDLLPALRIPDSRCSIEGDGDYAASVRRERRAAHPVFVAAQNADLIAARRVPDPRHSVKVGGDYAASVR